MPSLLLSLPSAPEPPNYVNIALEPTYTVQKPNTPLDGLAPQGPFLNLRNGLSCSGIAIVLFLHISLIGFIFYMDAVHN